jgi:hypothetical protein
MALCKFILHLGLSLTLLRFASAGAWGLGLPFVVERLLYHYGYATTLRAYAIGIVGS